MGDRKIIYIPKEYHDQADKMKGRQLRVFADDDLFGNGPVPTTAESGPHEPQLDMKQVKKVSKEVAERVGGTYRNLPHGRRK